MMSKAPYSQHVAFPIMKSTLHQPATSFTASVSVCLWLQTTVEVVLLVDQRSREPSFTFPCHIRLVCDYIWPCGAAPRSTTSCQDQSVWCPGFLNTHSCVFPTQSCVFNACSVHVWQTIRMIKHLRRGCSRPLKGICTLKGKNRIRLG